MNNSRAWGIILPVLLLLIINFSINSPFFKFLKAIVAIILATFIPGYLFCLLILRRNNPEILIISIAMSICFVILIGIVVHFLRIPIDSTIILNIIWVLTTILTITLISKNQKILVRKNGKEINGIFLLNFILLLLFILALILTSVIMEPDEEFAELSWTFIKVEDPWEISDVSCENITCSLSGVNKFKPIKINQEEYPLLFLDINTPGKYDSICIDFDRDGVFCEDDEGPIWSSKGFLIGENAYSYNFLDNGIIIFNFPRRMVNMTDFIVSYTLQSHYSRPMEFDISLRVNNRPFSEKEILLNPGEKAILEEEVSIPEELGKYKVEIIVSPKTNNRSAIINFFVEYSTNF
jgi:hypothetical protein